MGAEVPLEAMLVAETQLRFLGWSERTVAILNGFQGLISKP